MLSKVLLCFLGQNSVHMTVQVVNFVIYKFLDPDFSSPIKRMQCASLFLSLVMALLKITEVKSYVDAIRDVMAECERIMNVLPDEQRVLYCKSLWYRRLVIMCSICMIAILMWTAAMLVMSFTCADTLATPFHGCVDVPEEILARVRN